MKKQYIRPKDVQEFLGLSRATVARLLKKPDFPKYKIGKAVVIDIDELEKWVHERKVTED